MRLTSFTDYGLRALMRIASDPERGFSTAELADEFDISRNHLAKIVQHLSEAGIVATRRGAGGGVTLAKPADSIKLGDVIRSLEEGQALVDCFMPAVEPAPSGTAAASRRVSGTPKKSSSNA